jgi:hypothetical protein
MVWVVVLDSAGDDDAVVSPGDGPAVGVAGDV